MAMLDPRIERKKKKSEKEQRFNQGYINEVPEMPRQQIDLRNRLRNRANYYLKNDSVHNEKAEDKIR